MFFKYPDPKLKSSLPPVGVEVAPAVATHGSSWTPSWTGSHRNWRYVLSRNADRRIKGHDAGWWFQTWFLFSIIYGIIVPIDSYFSRWLKPPTRMYDECAQAAFCMALIRLGSERFNGLRPVPDCQAVSSSDLTLQRAQHMNLWEVRESDSKHV